MHGLLITLHVIVSFFLIISILLQPSNKSSGLGGFISNSNAANSAFGARGSAPILVKLTYCLAVVMMVTALMIGIFIVKENRSILDYPQIAKSGDNTIGSDVQQIDNQKPYSNA